MSPRLAARRDLMEWRPWVGTGLGEDVVMGLLCRAAGLEMRSLTGPGEPFGLAYLGLPKEPRALIAAGHSVVHSVKADASTEATWRDEFRRARAGDALSIDDHDVALAPRLRRGLGCEDMPPLEGV